MKLSIETKELVNQGIFSLYALEESEASSMRATFVLSTGDHSDLLGEAGEVVKELDLGKRFKVTTSIDFPEITENPVSIGKINIA